MRDYNEFIETKKRFEASTPNVIYPITYQEWLTLPHEFKASALFVTFFEQMLLAAKKFSSPNIVQEDVISALMFKLIQVVDTVQKDAKKYTTAYLYTIAKNALIDYNRVISNKNYWENTQSNIQVNSNDMDDTEYDIFDSLCTPDSEQDPLMLKSIAETGRKLMILLNSNNDTIIKVIEYLLGQKKTLSKNVKRDLPTILSELREFFSEQASYYKDIRLDCDTFEDVINNKELINSCTVVLEDGTEAVWLGDMDVYKNGAIRYKFISEQSIHTIPKSRAITLKVINVEAIE